MPAPDAPCPDRVGIACGGRFAAAALPLWLMALAAPAPAAELVTLQSETHELTVRAIRDDRVVSEDVTLDLFDLRRIARDVTVQTPPPTEAARLDLIDGSRLIVSDPLIRGDRVHFNWRYGQDVQLPVQAVRGVTLTPLTSRDGEHRPEPVFRAALAAEQAGADTLFVKGEEGIVTVDGVLEGLDDQQAAFQWNERTRQVARDRLYGLTLARTAQPPSDRGRVTVRTADGSRIKGKLQQMREGVLSVRLFGDTTANLPWSEVAWIDVHSPRLRYLSDLEPSGVRQDGWPTYAWPPRMDQTVMGGPLRLAGRVYERGIGVIAHTRLRFQLDEPYDLFAAVIGIDDDAEGRGDCVFVVKGDGRELLRQRQRGGDAPRPIRVDIAGVERLTLTVEKGEDLNLGDHADWADARLIRLKSTPADRP